MPLAVTIECFFAYCAHGGPVRLRAPDNGRRWRGYASYETKVGALPLVDTPTTIYSHYNLGT